MEVISLSCNHCGAPLDVGAQVKFVTCSYCQSRLKVMQSSNSAWTEVLDDIRESQKRVEATANDIAEDLEVIKAQNDLEQFDREWDKEQQRYLVRDRNGNLRDPESTHDGKLALLFIIPGIIFLGFFMSFASNMNAPPLFIFFPVIVVIIIVLGALSSLSESKAYSKRVEIKNQRRQLLLKRLEEARRRSN